MRDKFYTIIEGLYTPSINSPAWQITVHVHVFRRQDIIERSQVLRAAGTGECKTNRGSRTLDGSVHTSCFEPRARQYSVVKPLARALDDRQVCELNFGNGRAQIQK
jgi:hypothetical protein